MSLFETVDYLKPVTEINCFHGIEYVISTGAIGMILFRKIEISNSNNTLYTFVLHFKSIAVLNLFSVLINY
jgi:hypothetical protein